ncbi:MAG: hypothetical protein ACFE7E_04310 [Candidatus Hodarchaeota archaeon]
MEVVHAVEKAIGGVEARRILLEELLEGTKTGLQLRHALARKFNVEMGSVSDARLYFNLQQLEEAGLIKRRREWKAKYAEILPEKIQAVRNFLGVKAPIIYIGGLTEDPSVIRSIRAFLDRRGRIKPEKYIFLTDEEMRGRVAGITEDVELLYLPKRIVSNSFDGVYEAIKDVVDRLIGEHEIMFDVTDGTRFSVLAMYSLAVEYGLRCFYVLEENRIVWIRG